MVKAVNDVAGRVGVGDEGGEVIRNQRQSRLAVAGWKAQVRPSVERLRSGVDVIGIRGAFVPLRQVIEDILQAIDARKRALERIKAPVFLINDDNVIDLASELKLKGGRDRLIIVQKGHLS